MLILLLPSALFYNNPYGETGHRDTLFIRSAYFEQKIPVTFFLDTNDQPRSQPPSSVASLETPPPDLPLSSQSLSVRDEREENQISQHQDEFLIDYQRLYTDLLREKDLLQEVNARSQNWLDQKEQRIQDLTAQVMGLQEKVKHTGRGRNLIFEEYVGIVVMVGDLLLRTRFRVFCIFFCASIIWLCLARYN